MEPEPIHCRDLRARALESVQPEAADVREHLGACGECARWLARLERRVAALRELTPVPAPPELDERVITALGPDARRERAVTSLARLGRLSTPVELDGAVGESTRANAPGRRRVPAVLERLVAEELADPAKARVRRFVGSLPRRHAAPELEARVQRELQRPRRRLSRSMRAGVAVSLAASILVAVVAPLLFSLRDMREKKHYPFRVEYLPAENGSVDLGAHLDPLELELLDGATGGWVSVTRI